MFFFFSLSILLTFVRLSLSDLQTLCLIKGNDCYRLLSFLGPLLNNLVEGSLRWYLLEATTLLAPCINVPTEDESIEGQRAKRE